MPKSLTSHTYWSPKALVQGEEGERTRKRKRATSELQKEAALAAEVDLKREEKGGGGGGGGGGGLKITQSNQCFPLGLKKIQCLLRAK